MRDIPRIVTGTKDYRGSDIQRRDHLINIVKSKYASYGYEPLETPAFEYLDTVSLVYGDEGDKLIYRVLNSGDFLNDVSPYDDYKAVGRKICKKGLRYDLTLPLMRHVCCNVDDIVFPYKRYQIQPVWRADRPQRGRYREFYQCDADIVGSSSLSCELELMSLVCDVFRKLGIIDFTIKLNHRDILRGVVEHLGYADRFNDVCTVVDRLDKECVSKVRERLAHIGMSANGVDELFDILGRCSSNDAFIDVVGRLCADVCRHKGIDDIRHILDNAYYWGVDIGKIRCDLSLVRGLAYYTGTVFEVAIGNVSVGSVVGGGRYTYALKQGKINDMIGVGLSFGIDRLLLALDELKLINVQQRTTDIMFTSSVGGNVARIVSDLRGRGLIVETYLNDEDLKYQLRYANRKRIRYVVFGGGDTSFIIKDMDTGGQIHCDDVLYFFKTVYESA